MADYDDQRMVGVCPECGVVVHTLFPGGVIAPHLYNPATGTVTFVPGLHPTVPRERRDGPA